MEEFIKQYHPEMMEEYKRYLRRNNPPAPGSIVQSLVIGFGGQGGQLLVVKEINENSIEFFDRSNTRYHSYRENWWKEFKIIDEKSNILYK